MKPEPVDQFGRPLDIPDREVAGFAGLDGADVVELAERARGFAGDAGNAFLDREAEQRRRHVHGQQQRGDRRGAGIAVGRDRDWHLVPAEGLDRRQLLLAQHIEGTGQQHRDRAGLRHRGDAGLVGIFEMIGRQRVVARRQRRAMQVRELVGMQLDRQAARLRRVEHARDLLGREGDALAEGIDGVGKAGLLDLRDHGADLGDEGVLVVLPPAAAHARRERS